ncbi:hypothetical protein J0H58_26080, partial [bacterium]|nr:hypothetical protein [bacterium]
MPGRLALLALVLALAALFPLSVNPRPHTAPPRLPAPREPSPAELAAAEGANRALGGGVIRNNEPPNEPYRNSRPVQIALRTEISPEQVDQLPDLEFDYELVVNVDPNTPPGLVARLARLRHLRRVVFGVHAARTPPPEMTAPPEPLLRVEFGVHAARPRDPVGLSLRPPAPPPPPRAEAAWMAELAALPHLEHLSPTAVIIRRAVWPRVSCSGIRGRGADGDAATPTTPVPARPAGRRPRSV